MKDKYLNRLNTIIEYKDEQISNLIKENTKLREFIESLQLDVANEMRRDELLIKEALKDE